MELHSPIIAKLNEMSFSHESLFKTYPSNGNLHHHLSSRIISLSLLHPALYSFAIVTPRMSNIRLKMIAFPIRFTWSPSSSGNSIHYLTVFLWAIIILLSDDNRVKCVSNREKVFPFQAENRVCLLLANQLYPINWTNNPKMHKQSE